MLRRDGGSFEMRLPIGMLFVVVSALICDLVEQIVIFFVPCKDLVCAFGQFLFAELMKILVPQIVAYLNQEINFGVE
jgi:hypothetical protein